MKDCTGKMREGVYNCFGDYDAAMCFDCIYNAKSEARRKKNKFKSQQERINEFYEYLMGSKLPEGMECRKPRLGADLAFTVIWFLQEHMHILPDNIEQCDKCKELYDSDSEGCHLDDQYDLIDDKDKRKPLPKYYYGSYCENCIPDIDFEVQ